MDRWHGLARTQSRKPIRALVAATVLLSCARPPATRPLSPGEAPATAADGLRARTRAASGVLTYAVALDPSRLRLVSVELSTAFELVVRDLDAAGSVTGTRRLHLGPPDYDIDGLSLSGARAWIASLDGTVRGVDIDRMELSTTWHLGDSATAVVATDDGAYVATGSRAGVLCLRRSEDGALVQCVVAHGGPVSALASSGEQLVSTSWDGTVAAWKLPSLAVSDRTRVDGSANDASLSPDGSRVAIAVSRSPPLRSPLAAERERAAGYRTPDRSAYIEVWTRGAQPLRIRGHGAPVTAVDWTPDGARIVSASWDRTVRLWDSRTGEEIDRIGGLSHIVRDVVVASDGRWAALGAWAVSDGEPSSMLLDLLYTVN